MEVADYEIINISASKSPLEFTVDEGEFNRYLNLDKEQFFFIGNVCGTCEFNFKSLTDVKKPVVDGVRDLLNSGISSLAKVPPELSQLFPDGQYLLCLLYGVPQLAGSGKTPDYFKVEMPRAWRQYEYEDTQNSEETPYYRTEPKLIKQKINKDSEAIFDFYIPQYDVALLNSKKIAEYSGMLKNGATPTALALSLLDIKTSAEWPFDEEYKEIQPDYITHWIFANYLLDGHHKIYASYLTQIPITILSFLSIENSCLSIENSLKFEKTNKFISTMQKNS